jgi:hypothetical protein
MSGRGDKDIFISAAALDGMSWRSFLKEESEQDGGAGDEGSGEAEA